MGSYKNEQSLIQFRKVFFFEPKGAVFWVFSDALYFFGTVLNYKEHDAAAKVKHLVALDKEQACRWIRDFRVVNA